MKHYARKCCGCPNILKVFIDEIRPGNIASGYAYRTAGGIAFSVRPNCQNRLRLEGCYMLNKDQDVWNDRMSPVHMYALYCEACGRRNSCEKFEEVVVE